MTLNLLHNPIRYYFVLRFCVCFCVFRFARIGFTTCLRHERSTITNGFTVYEKHATAPALLFVAAAVGAALR